jgi:hypothetical protein
MKKLLNVSTASLVRAGAILCAICFITALGCRDTIPICEITVSGPGSICNIVYNDSNGVDHRVIIQADSDTITIEDCDEVLEVNCS